MALNSLYVVGPPLQEYFVDKDSGLPLASGFLYFYHDNDRSTPKDIFELSGVYPDYSYTALPNPVVLSSVGTVQDNSGNDVVIYYYPYDVNGDLDLYYVVCTDSNGVVQFTRGGWPNSSVGSSDLNELSNENQIANPQFTQSLINVGIPTVYTVSAASEQVCDFAPDWQFVISGTGTVTVEILPLSAADQVVTNPPFALNVIVSAGVTQCLLRQRFVPNSGLWASTDSQSIVLTATLVATSAINDTALQMFYQASSGTLQATPVNILNASLQTGSYVLYQGSSNGPMPSSNDSDEGNDGYVDIYLSFPTSTNISVTSIQVIPVISDVSVVLGYNQNSANRLEAFMGDYYIPRLEYKPIPSLLIGWDFVVNPGQFGFTQTMTNSATYLWDQTICASTTTSNAVAKNAVSFGFEITTGAANEACYLMQYFDLSYAKRLIGSRLSVNINGYVTTNHSVIARVYLFRAPNATSYPSLPTSLGTIATSGVFTLTAAGWTEIPRSGLPTAQATLTFIADNTGINGDNVDYGFSGWEITDNTQVGDTNKFAIVVTLAYTDISVPIVINSISLVPGDIPTRPAPTTYNECLLECKRFYEKSYEVGTAVGESTPNGQISVPFDWYTVGANSLVINKSFTLQYMTNKQTQPIVTFYSPTAGTADTIVAGLLVNGAYPTAGAGAGTNPYNITVSTTYTPTGATRERVYMLCGTTASGNGVVTSTHLAVDSIAIFHYQADARLGIV